MKVSGSSRKACQLNPEASAPASAIRLTTDSCAFAYQPRKTSVTARKPRRNQSTARALRVSWFWKKKAPVSTRSMAASATISGVLSRQMRFQSSACAALSPVSALASAASEGAAIGAR